MTTIVTYFLFFFFFSRYLVVSLPKDKIKRKLKNYFQIKKNDWIGSARGDDDGALVCKCGTDHKLTISFYLQVQMRETKKTKTKLKLFDVIIEDQ